MKKYFRILFIIAFSLNLLLITACEEEKAEANEKNVEKEKSVNVEIQTVNTTNYKEKINTIGTVKPYRKANITFAEGGIIEKFLKDKGDFVKTGDTLFVIDNDIYKANYDAALAQYNLAEMNYGKQKQIYDDNASSEFQYLQAKYNRDQAKAAMELALARYNKTFVTAPFSGIFDSKLFESGELVPPSFTVVNLIDASKFKVMVGVPEQYIGEVKIGDRAIITFNGNSKHEYYGNVNFVSQSVNTSNRTFEVEVDLNKADFLKPEIVVDVAIEVGTTEDVIQVPEDAVIRTDKGFIVFVIEDDLAYQREVNIFSRFGKKVILKSGLKDGDKLVVVGQNNLISGTKVNVVN